MKYSYILAVFTLNNYNNNTNKISLRAAGCRPYMKKRGRALYVRVYHRRGRGRDENKRAAL